jgi:hypothetical protein
MQPEYIIQLYNKLAAMCFSGGFYKGIISLGTRRREQAIKLDNELRLMEAPIGPYLTSCFVSHGWGYRPAFDKLLNKKYIDYFNDNKAAVFVWWEILMREWQCGTSTQRTHRGYEIVKSYYKFINKLGLCRVEKSFSGGYNRYSVICKECSLRSPCESDQFSV